MSNDLRRGRHVVYNLHAHLVFVAKYRRKVFTKEILDDMQAIFEEVCSKFEAQLVEFDGDTSIPTVTAVLYQFACVDLV